MNRFAGLQLALFGLAAGMRHASEEVEADIQTPMRDFSLVDIADMIRNLDASGTLRCCCDAPKHSSMHWHSMSDHSGRCSVDFRAGGHCRDFGRNGRPWQLGRMHHYTSTGNWCRIAQLELDTVVRSIGRLNPSFCEQMPQDTATGMLSVPAARLDEVVSVTCSPGFRAASSEVTCSFDTQNSSNFLDPTPQCDRIPDYCAAAAVGPMSVVSAGVGDVVDVDCAFQTLRTTQVTCGEDAQYDPEPACPEPPEDATSRAAFVESSGSGRCCCDVAAAGLWGWLDAEDARTGHCQIYEGYTHCKDVHSTARLVHYTRTAEERCTIYH